MATIITMPRLSDTMEEGTVARDSVNVILQFLEMVAKKQ